MGGRRSWVVAAVLLLLGAVTGAGAVREHWVACRGSMLSGSVLHGYAYGAEFSDACLETMDLGFAFVWPGGAARFGPESLLGASTAALLAGAWAVVVVSSAWSRATKTFAGLPAVATAAAGGLSLLRGGDSFEAVYGWLLLAVDVLAVVAFLVVAVSEQPGVLAMLQVALVLVASSALGAVANVLGYVFMVAFSDANWDDPPGTGYSVVVAVALLALALLVVTFVRTSRAPTPEVVVGAGA